MSSKSLRANFLWNASYQVLLILVPLVTTPYLARVLGASQIGVFSYTNSITNYFVLFATLGMGQYGVRVVAQAGGDRTKRSRIFSSAYAAQLCIAVPVFLIYIVVVVVAPFGDMLVSFAWGAWVLAALLDISWLFFGVEEFKMPTVRSAFTKLASVFVIFGFVKGPDDLWIYVAAIAGSYLANALLLWPFLKKYVDLCVPRWSEVRSHFAPNVRLFAPVVACSMYLMLDKILLAAMAGTVETGYYEYSEKLAKMPTSVITALGTVMLPHVTAMMNHGDRDREVVNLLEQCFWIMECVAIGVMTGVGAIAPVFTAVFLGSEFTPCENIIPVLAAVVPLIAASNVIGVQYMLPKGKDREYAGSVWAGAIVNLFLCCLLLKPFGAMGGAVAAVLTEVTVLVSQCLTVRKELPLVRLFGETVPFLIMGAGMFLVVRVASVLLSALAGDLIVLIIEIVIGVAVYLMFAIVWCKLTGRLGFVRKLLAR